MIASVRSVRRTDRRRLAQWCLGCVAASWAALATLEAASGSALPSAYFPADVARPGSESEWRALARDFPNRVKEAHASDAPPAADPVAEPVELRKGLVYLRVRNLDRDAAAVRAAIVSPALILDLRQVDSSLEDALALGNALTRRPVAIEAFRALESASWTMEPAGSRAASQLTFVLVNRATAGPLETVLDALQEAGQILLVGTPTKGDTGWFESPKPGAHWRVIAGEYRRAGGPSLLDRGVAPGLLVEVDPEADRAAYAALEEGTPLAALLDAPIDKSRFDEARLLRQHGADIRVPRIQARTDREAPAVETGGTPAVDAENRDPALVLDRVLHRAVNTMVALEALNRLPAR